MEEKRAKRSAGVTITLIVMGLLVFYPLSAGPVFWLEYNGWIPDRRGFLYLTPLNRLLDWSPDRIVDWYMEYLRLFVDLPR